MISEKNAEFPLTVGPDVLDLSKDVWGLFFLPDSARAVPDTNFHSL